MANVCFVPLSFLFTRGQGIKGFSLCTKYFQDEGYLFPVLFKKITFRDGKDPTLPMIRGEVVYSRTNFNNDSDDERIDNSEILNIKIRKTVKNKTKVEIIERKSTDILIEQSGGYEGAIVFDPEPTVEYEYIFNDRVE